MFRQRISSAHPVLIVMVLDNPGNTDHFPGTTRPEYQLIEMYLIRTFKELLARSTVVFDGGFKVHSRYFVYTVLYGGETVSWPPGATEEIPLDALIKRANPTGPRLGLTDWDGVSGRYGPGDARTAFEQAYAYLQRAVTKERFKDSFPPIVFHISRGYSATDPEPIVDKIKHLATSDGEVLVVNALLGFRTNLTYTDPSDFPGYLSEEEAGPDRYSRQLFRLSSVAPEAVRENLVGSEIFPRFRQGARLFFDVRTQDMLRHIFSPLIRD